VVNYVVVLLGLFIWFLFVAEVKRVGDTLLGVATQCVQAKTLKDLYSDDIQLVPKLNSIVVPEMK